MRIEPKTLAILSSAEIPMVQSIALELNDLILNEHCAPKDIADIIKKDAALTAMVLKAANSAGFNAPKKIRSIHHAVEKLGTQGIKSVFISIMMIDSLGKRPEVQKRLMHCLGRAFFASVLSKNFVEARGQQVGDDVIVAALLLHLGEMLFWSSTHPKVRQAAHRVSNGEPTRRVIEDSLGIELSKLSLYFAKKWQLSELLMEALKRPRKITSKARCIIVADVASEILQVGSGKRNFSSILANSSKLLDCDTPSALSIIQKSLREATRLAEFYGVDQVREFLEEESRAIDTFVSPSVSPSAAELETAQNKASSKEKEKEKEKEKTASNNTNRSTVRAQRIHSQLKNAGVKLPYAKKQRQFTEQLEQLFEAKIDMNGLFRAMVDGLHDHLDFDRIAIALTNFERNEIKARHIYGHGMQSWLREFRFDIGPDAQNIFKLCIEERRSITLHSLELEYRQWLPEKLTSLIDYNGEFIIAPLFAADKPLAILYVDCFEKKCAISDDQFASLERLVAQSNSGFASLS